MGRAIRTAWREVRTIFLGLAILTGVGLATRQRWLAALGGLLWAWVCYFFRDPDRTPQDSDEAVILAAADGRIQRIEVVEEPRFFQGPARRIVTFLSLLDVHVQRSPYTGTVQQIHYQPGAFLPAYRPEADANEANFIGLSTPRGPLAVVQMTGVLARRIVCWRQPGDTLQRGERFGLIRFGSRVDLYLPLEAEVFVQVGQQVYGGQTPVARWPGS
ncbi:phosphatidylserine decarboxylase [Litorilinea aerophila]|uniref:Phosphatidylserine decarboxylase n=1 Tax=Litorilinea aerophila TaxID=1204385 RepID=A0A540VB07_9CHLR|nr:phosphatidylserine decarboxylase [Litorilinea aerophila]MCC9078220.1 phosphatidylserine decarboxylase [Litorilinea aerophila]GIV80190.1 MAG: phosphatidylserine decarboxylase proenzyme [Litorilinea sp.]